MSPDDHQKCFMNIYTTHSEFEKKIELHQNISHKNKALSFCKTALFWMVLYPKYRAWAFNDLQPYIKWEKTLKFVFDTFVLRNITA